MAYIGLEPSNSFVSLKRQVITGDGTASYTLDHSVASVNDAAIFVNNVRQDPASYSISGTALTLGGTIESSDDCYVIFLGQALQTVTPDSDTITTAMLKSNAVTSAKLTYPLTTFSSTGIDDNASANALTIDSSSNLQFNSGFGSVATAYAVRAWVKFNGSGTLSVGGSGNVGSVTDNGTGEYTLNFTNNMPDTNYAYVTTACDADGTRATLSQGATKSTSALTVDAVRYTTDVSVVDLNDCNVAILR
jgi:hypothetical protein